MLGLVLLLGSFAYYLKSLPWHNDCATRKPTAAPPGPPTNAAVATSQPRATAAAADVLAHGGSAADAAVAAALMLAVTEPGNSGLGGGGFALVFDPLKKASVVLDFREQAPGALSTQQLTAAVARDPNALRNGALAVAVPSEWPGLLELHRRYGRLPLPQLAAPAIAVARQGNPLNVEHCARCWVRLSALRAQPDARAIFLGALGLCPMPGAVLRQPALARTLFALAAGASFEQVVGRKLVDFLRARGSAIRLSDFAREQVTLRQPVRGSFAGRSVVSVGPPSSGGLIVVSMLQTYERMRARFPQANRFHLWTQASRLAFFDRAALYGDPAFVNVPVEKLASPQYAQELAQRVSADGPVALPMQVAPAREGDHTTHLSVVDKDGMGVALTMTINVPFGSGLVVPGTGVLLNNEMDDFYLQRPNSFELVGNANNAPAAGKRPLSSMAPTMVFEGDRLVMVLGSPGGSAIPGAVAQVIRNVFEDRQDGDTAVCRGRIHHQWLPDKLEVEPYFERSALPAYLSQSAKAPLFPLGRVQMVLSTATGWRGVSDCRDQGVSWSGTL